MDGMMTSFQQSRFSILVVNIKTFKNVHPKLSSLNSDQVALIRHTVPSDSWKLEIMPNAFLCASAIMCSGFRFVTLSVLCQHDGSTQCVSP